VPWVLAYRRDDEYSFTTAAEPFRHAASTRWYRNLTSAAAGPHGALVWARHFPTWDQAEAELRRIESMTNQATIDLVERENPSWIDYVRHRPDRLRPPGDDGGAGTPARPSRPPGGPNLTLEPGYEKSWPPPEDN
jgi:hypothetical protein